MSERVFGWWVLGSLALHAVGLLVLGGVWPRMEFSPRTAVAIEVVRLPAAEPLPPPPPPPPRPKPAAPRVASAPPQPAPAAQVPNLLDSPAPPRVEAPPSVGSLVPSPLASAMPALGAPAGAGTLSGIGDLLVAPGSGTSAGGGGTGPRGQGTGATGASSSQVASTGTGLTSLARPLGGYQIKPEYPEGARRDRAEGVALLRFEVLATGRVGGVTVARSAGHRELDRAAIEAIRQWQFEPARRGATAVTVWVTLPVRFELTDR